MASKDTYKLAITALACAVTSAFTYKTYQDVYGNGGKKEADKFIEVLDPALELGANRALFGLPIDLCAIAMSIKLKPKAYTPEEFRPSQEFTGPVEGFVFKRDKLGVGYYKDKEFDAVLQPEIEEQRRRLAEMPQ
ncbi:hypothetical protein FOZ62_031896 [Perkinsus olseni]|uniref:Uncharacterized protein n=1 Tax=Perkinsus olseni TaxID=32597 RepID=A0A7J6UEU5_PEROL|nr:hypothetical protein FOZ62_031896 [Perkinsus olseni]